MKLKQYLSPQKTLHCWGTKHWMLWSCVTLLFRVFQVLWSKNGGGKTNLQVAHKGVRHSCPFKLS